MNAITHPIPSIQTSTRQLSSEQLDALGKELDALRDAVSEDVGEKDANYIKKVIRNQRLLEIGSRAALHFSFTPVGFLVGSVGLGIAKIIENMEIGHNVLHGQYDWMNDPKIHSHSYEWDNVCDSQSWKRTHNFEHHTYTNIIGKDRDYGYAAMRLSDDEPWHPLWRFNLLYAAMLGVFFQWGVALHELETEKLRSREISIKDKLPMLKDFSKKSSRQLFKDYVFFPALAGPFFWKVAAGNLMANGIRNVWTAAIIYCGHFTEDAQTFSQEECINESKGHWYYRQMQGSSNFSGKPWLHFMSGHLSFQIEHHLFPDIPARRYPEIAVQVEAICEKYGIHYNTGSFWSQFKTVVKRVWKHSKPPQTDTANSGQLTA